MRRTTRPVTKPTIIKSKALDIKANPALKYFAFNRGVEENKAHATRKRKISSPGECVTIPPSVDVDKKMTWDTPRNNGREDGLKQNWNLVLTNLQEEVLVSLSKTSEYLSLSGQNEKWEKLSSVIAKLRRVPSSLSASDPTLSSTLNLILSCHLGFFSFEGRHDFDYLPKCSGLVEFTDHVLERYPEHESLALAWSLAFKAANGEGDQSADSRARALKMVESLFKDSDRCLLDFHVEAMKVYFSSVNNQIDLCAHLLELIFSDDGKRAWATLFEPSPMDTSILNIFLRHTVPYALVNAIPRARFQDLPPKFLDQLPPTTLDFSTVLQKMRAADQERRSANPERAKRVDELLAKIKEKVKRESQQLLNA